MSRCHLSALFMCTCCHFCIDTDCTDIPGCPRRRRASAFLRHYAPGAKNCTRSHWLCELCNGNPMHDSRTPNLASPGSVPSRLRTHAHPVFKSTACHAAVTITTLTTLRMPRRIATQVRPQDLQHGHTSELMDLLPISMTPL